MNKKVMLAVAVYHVVASQWSSFKTVWCCLPAR